jgi:aldehyde dehydrogenase (NAD+)
VVYRDPYGVALIMGPFNGPLTLMVRPALAALGGGNTCVLKLHPGLAATSPLLLGLVPRYFDPAAVTAVLSDIEETTELLKLPFDFNREPPTAKLTLRNPGGNVPRDLSIGRWRAGWATT